MDSHRIVPKLFVVLLFLGVVSAARADLSVSLQDNAGASNATTVRRGSFFDLSVVIDTDIAGLYAGGFQLQDLSASAIFTLEAVTFGPHWDNEDWAIKPAPIALTAESGYLSGQIGSTARDLDHLPGSGRMATLRLLVSGSAEQGDYRLNLAEIFPGEGIADWADSDMNTYTAQFGRDYTVTVTNAVPAPGAALLAGIGLGVVGWIKRRLA